jgi:DNA-directed RNA polymerase sigma subunit (sigma70/sigma32)
VGLVHWVIQRDYHSVLPYAELLHEGQIALWQAVLRYDPARGFRLAFSTYAVPAIRRRLWDAVAQAQRPRGYAVLAVAPDPAELAVLSGTTTRCGTGGLA